MQIYPAGFYSQGSYGFYPSAVDTGFNYPTWGQFNNPISFDFQNQPNLFSFQTPAKKKMSTSTKLIIGGIITIVATALIMYFTKGKGAKAATNNTVPKNINKTVQEAADAIGAASVPQPQQMTKQTLKKFIDSEGKEISGVSIKGGKALTNSGSAFSGVMQTTNPKGKTVKITYSNGFITQSEIDGNLFSTFEAFENMPREKAVHVTRFENGAAANHRIRFYHDNGKIKRIYKTTGDNLLWSEATAIDYSEAGKKTAEAEYANAGQLNKLTQFDDDGKKWVYQANTDKPTEFTASVLRTDDSVYKKITGTSNQLGYLHQNYINHSGNEFSIANVQQVQLCDSKGMPCTTYRINERTSGFDYFEGNKLNPTEELIIVKGEGGPDVQTYNFSPNQRTNLKLKVGNGNVEIIQCDGNQKSLLQQIISYLNHIKSTIDMDNINYFDRENLAKNIEILKKYIETLGSKNAG